MEILASFKSDRTGMKGERLQTMLSKMEQQWNIVYYETVDGKCEVKEFIESLKVREQAKILGWIEQLQKEGPNLRRPYADFLKDGIHEVSAQ